jgi:hypothetical protein
MFKSLLKAIFPRAFLKKAFAIYNAFKIRTVDKILFPEYVVAKSDFLIYKEGYPFRENEVNIDDIEDEAVRAYMRKWNDWTQEEYVLQFEKPCYIEPDLGWAIVSKNHLLYYSLGISRTLFLPKPDLVKFRKKKNVITVKKAISLRDTGEENYFHFYNDVLTKLYFLEQVGIPIEQTPVIISKKLWNKEYFQYYLNHNTRMKALNWLLQDNEYIRSESTIFCKALTHRPDLYTRIFSSLRVVSAAHKKIFLTRNKKRLRHISNEAEVRNVFMKYDFETVDADLLSIADQIKVFSGAAFIAGVHGAGLTNLMFRVGPCKVLEIFPYPDQDYLPFHYIMIAKLKGFSYNGLIGKKAGKFADSFAVDVSELEAALRKFLL